MLQEAQKGSHESLVNLVFFLPLSHAHSYIVKKCFVRMELHVSTQSGLHQVLSYNRKRNQTYLPTHRDAAIQTLVNFWLVTQPLGIRVDARLYRRLASVKISIHISTYLSRPCFQIPDENEN